MKSDLSLSRREIIAERLANGQSVVVLNLAGEFEVSEDAIRRDLRALASEGRARRVYGGALPSARPGKPISARITQDTQRKQRLARSAITTVQPNEVVFLDSSSANVAIADILPLDRGLTIVTNSVDVAQTVLGRGATKMIIVGGSVDPTVGGAVDGSAVTTVQSMNFDCAFVGGCAISTTGVSAQDYADSLFKRAVIKNSRRRIVIATMEKFKETAPFKVCDPADIDRLIVESQLSIEDGRELEDAGYQLARAAPRD